MRIKLWILLCLIAPTALAKSKYNAVVIKESRTEANTNRTLSAAEAAIRDHIVAELGEKPRYKSGGERVLAINLIEQLAGPNEGKFLADILYISDPNLVGTINKGGLIIGAMRVSRALARDKKLRAIDSCINNYSHSAKKFIGA